jgi:hypothetical protein
MNHRVSLKCSGGSEQRVNGADQGDKADQHRQNNHRHFKAGQNIFPEFSTFIVLSVINPTRPGSEQEIKLEKLHESQSFFEIKVLNIFRISAATTYLASSMVI